MKKKAEEVKAAGLVVFGMDNIFFKKYEALQPKNEYDREKAEALAEAMTELVAVKKRKNYLEGLLAENRELKPFLWESMDGRVQALHAIDEGHFENIIRFLVARGRSISKEIRAEAAARGIEVPESYTAESEGFDWDDEDDMWDF